MNLEISHIPYSLFQILNLSFYRTYRPQLLTDLVGQDHVRQTFLNALQRGSLVHAYLFTGPRGTGKTSTARIIARAITCEKPQADGEPCNTCSVCEDALAGRLVDLIEIDAASNRGIDEIRDLKEKIQFSPSRAKAKVYIIDEVHMLTKDAFNALLKTLEEPPIHAYFILATTEIHKVPETIISRCQRFDFHRISNKEIAEHLGTVAKKENITADSQALELIASQSAGGMRDALGLLEQIGSSGSITSETIASQLGLTRPVAVAEFVHAILFGQVTAGLTTIETLVGEGANLTQFNKAVMLKLRELMLEKITANKIGEAKHLVTIIEIFAKASEELRTAIIPQLPLEVATIAACTGDTPAAPAGQGHSKQRDSETAPQVSLRDDGQQTTKIPPSSRAETRDPENKKQTAEDSKTTNNPNASPSPTLTPNTNTITIASLTQHFPAIIKAIPIAHIRTALKEAQILRIDADKVIIGLTSDLYLEKLSTPEGKNAVATAISTTLGQPVSVAFERVEIPSLSSAPTPKPKNDLGTMAENLFAEEDGF